MSQEYRTGIGRNLPFGDLRLNNFRKHSLYVQNKTSLLLSFWGIYTAP